MAALLVEKAKNAIWDSFAKETFPKNFEGFKNIIFVGRTSVGKSSLLNKLFATKLKTSKGSCTKTISTVAKFDNVRVFDCPGFDTHFNLT